MDTRNRRSSTNLYTEQQIRRVIEGSGIDIENEVDSDFIIFCPYHNNNRTPAGEISKEYGTFFCFSCHEVRPLEEFVMHVTNRSYFEAIRFIKSKEDSNSNIEQIVNKALYVAPDFVQFDEVLLKRLNNQALESPRAMRYYEGRLINRQSVVKFNLGYSDKQDMVTIPVQSPDGLDIGFVGRSIEGKEFKNTPGLPKAKILFNLHRVKNQNTIYVVESSFDAIRLDQVGLPAVATLGSNVSRTQTDLLDRYFNNIVLIADNDEAGKSMQGKLQERLPGKLSVVKLETKYKDIGDMDDESLKAIEFRFDNSISAMLK
jgi:DNA primase